MDTKLELSDNLEKYRENIEATIKQYIEIKTTESKKLSLWQSKFGGFPYFPKEMDYPKDSKGQPMHLLAQINFNETPRLEGYPEKGILQFYISGNDDVYGICFDDPYKQDDFRVLYFPEIIKSKWRLRTNFKFLPKAEDLPLDKQFSLTFRLCSEPISHNDYQFESKVFNVDDDSKSAHYDENEELYTAYQNLTHSLGHKIGGYPFFTQYDPREHNIESREQDILLFQMDSDIDANIMWGDVGVANFFISAQDLENLDFSHVLYNWDCF